MAHLRFVCLLRAPYSWFNQLMSLFGANQVYTCLEKVYMVYTGLPPDECPCHTHWPKLVPLIKTLGKDSDKKCMHTLCTLFLGVCTPRADFFWVHAHFFQTLKIPPFSPSCTGSFRIPVSLIGLITSPTSLDRNSKVLFSVVLKGLKSLHSLHGVHEVCTGLPPMNDDGGASQSISSV